MNKKALYVLCGTFLISLAAILKGLAGGGMETAGLATIGFGLLLGSVDAPARRSG